MKKEEIFYTLGIEPTKDESVIKNAYRNRLVVTNPEDNPEGFKLLRQAYEEACVYAKQDEESRERERDTTLSGLWVEKAAAIYKSISSRCNIEEWKALFNEEIFISLDTNEECRIKLLVFIMDHFRFPKEVWELFEKHLCVVNNAKQLKEDFPADFIDYIVQKCKGNETMDYSLFTGPDEGDYDFFLKCYSDSWGTLSDDNLEQTEEILRKADASKIAHPYLEITRACLYEKRGEKETAKQLFLQLNKQFPEDETIIYQMAEFFFRNKEKELAKDFYIKLKEKKQDNYMANYRLAYFYDELEEDEAAKACIRIVSRYGCDDEFAKLRIRVNGRIEKTLEKKWMEEGDIDSGLELFKCYLQDETFFKGAKFALEIVDQLPKDKQTDFDGLMTRCYVSQAKYEDAIAMADQWLLGLEQELSDATGENRIKLEKDIYSAHEIKMVSYHYIALGKPSYYKEAKKEYEIIKQLKDVEAKTLVDVARIYLDSMEYEKCIEVTETLVEKYQMHYAYTIMLDAYVRMWDATGVISTAKACNYYFPEYATAYEECAKVFCDLEKEEDLQNVLADAKENKIDSEYLDSWYIQGKIVPEDFPINKKIDEFEEEYDQKLKETGNITYYEKGYQVVTEYLKMYPCNYILNQRGLFSMAAKEYDEARKDFQKILDKDPADQFGYNNLGCLSKYEGNYEEALVYFEHAKRYMYREGKEEPNLYPQGNMAHTFELMGEYANAAKVYQELIDQLKDISWSTIRDVTANYARSGQLDKAMHIIDEYGNQWYRKYVTLLKYRCYLYAGKWQEAKQFLSKAQKIKDDLLKEKKRFQTSQEYYHRLAWYQVLNGEGKDVFKNLDAALAATATEDIKIKLDIISDKIFFLTLDRFKNKVEEKNKKYANLLSMTILNQDLQWLEDKALKTGKVRDAIYSGEFFYKDRYVMYIEFLVALYTNGLEEGKKVFEEMKNSNRCRLCNHGQCARLVYAQAMLLEMENKKEEAYQLYMDLLEKQPYNMYALAKTIIKA